MGYRDDEREKLSFSELDKLRSNNRHSSGSSRREDQPIRSDYRAKQYMRKAGLLFKKGKSTQGQAALQALENAGTPEAFVEAANEILEAGVPDDWDLLIVLLDHPGPDEFEKITDHLAGRFAEQPAAKQEVAASKLRMLAVTSKDADIVEIAKEALERIEG